MVQPREHKSVFSNNYKCCVTFENCEFENADLIASLKLQFLSLINCKIKNYSFINIFEKLNQLTIINGEIEISKINLIRNLKYLQISYSNIVDDTELMQKSQTSMIRDSATVSIFKSCQ